jgi:predicted nucleic acid-binding Zn ribbon protein
MTKRDKRNLRTQQILFIGIGIIVILSMVLAMIAK